LRAIRVKWHQASRTAEEVSTFADASRVVTRALPILAVIETGRILCDMPGVAEETAERRVSCLVSCKRPVVDV